MNTYEEHYQCFKIWQQLTAQKSLQYHIQTIEKYYPYVKYSGYNPTKDYQERCQKREESISHLQKIVDYKGNIINPIYWAYWCKIKDKPYTKDYISDNEEITQIKNQICSGCGKCK